MPMPLEVLVEYKDGTEVEMPNEGDPIRTQLPNNLPSGATAQSTTNWMFEAANRGKKSICIDLRHPNTKPVMKRLTEWADIVVDNFRSPNIMKGWGYGYEDNIIYLSLIHI